MPGWEKARQRILEYPGKTSAWRSDQKHLLQVFKRAEAWDLSSMAAEQATISNLRTIIRFARKAVKVGDKARLAELLAWASHLTNSDLRLRLGTPDLEDIEVRRVPNTSPPVFQLSVNKEQLERIRRATKLNHRYQVVDPQKKMST